MKYFIENKNQRSFSRNSYGRISGNGALEVKAGGDESRAHYHTYLKPRILENKDIDKFNALKSIETVLGVRSTGSQAEYLEQVINKLYHAPATVNMQVARIPKISSTEFRNVWSVGERGGEEDMWSESEQRSRDATEQFFFQYSESADIAFKRHATWRFNSRTANSDFDPNSRPIYAALHAIQPFLVGGAPEYGDAAFYLRDHIKEHSTVSSRDTLFLLTDWFNERRDYSTLAPRSLGVFGSDGVERSNLYPVVASATKNQLLLLTELGSVEDPVDYIELHSHGGLSISEDVSHVAISALPSASLGAEINDTLGGLFGHPKKSPQKS